jgi:hypothetical protein
MNCGAKIEDGEKFCTGCGAPREVAAGTPETSVSAASEASDTTVAAVFCMNCGARMEASGRFCEECGFDRSATAPYAARGYGGGGARSAAKIILSLAAVVLILAACGVAASKYIFGADIVAGVKNIASGVLPWEKNPASVASAQPARSVAPPESDSETQAAAQNNFPAPINPQAPSQTRAPDAVQPTEAPMMSEGYITGSDVNFRQSPNGEKKRRRLQINDRVKVLALQYVNGDPWCRVVFNGEEGWVSGKYISETPRTMPQTAPRPAQMPAAPQPADNTKKARSLLAEGKGHWNRGNWQLAYEAFEKAYRLAPTDEIERYREIALHNARAERMAADARAGAQLRNIQPPPAQSRPAQSVQPGMDTDVSLLLGEWRAVRGKAVYFTQHPDKQLKNGTLRVARANGNSVTLDGRIDYADSSGASWSLGFSRDNPIAARISGGVMNTAGMWNGVIDSNKYTSPFTMSLELIDSDTLTFHKQDMISEETATFKRVSR